VPPFRTRSKVIYPLPCRVSGSASLGLGDPAASLKTAGFPSLEAH
jgi:hypothetical protein